MNKKNFHIGSRIAELLKKYDIPKTKVADKLGIHRSNISDLTKRESITTDTLEKIAEATGIPMYEFFMEESSKLEEPETSYSTTHKKYIEDRITDLENDVKNLKKLIKK